MHLSNLKHLAKQHKWPRCGYFFFTDLAAGLKQMAGSTRTHSGRRHAGLPITSSLEYIDKVHREYLEYCNRNKFHGVVAELGPGDNLGFALLALKTGADRVIAIDKFYSERSVNEQNRIYEAMAQKWSLKDSFDGPPSESNILNLDRVYNMSADKYFQKSDLGFDFIVSRAVLEHILFPIETLEIMSRKLNCEGYLIHRVDLRDHGMFPHEHPLTFLTIPNFFYRKMVRNTGRPNRIPVSRYRAWLENSQLQGEIKITRLIDSQKEYPAVHWDDLPTYNRRAAIKLLTKIRPTLAREFRHEKDEDLAVAGFVLCANRGHSNNQELLIQENKRLT